MKYRYLGDYAYVFHVGENLVNTAPGDFIELSDEDAADEYNKRMIDEGHLVSLEQLSGEQPASEEVVPPAAEEGSVEATIVVPNPDEVQFPPGEEPPDVPAEEGASE